MKTMTKSQQGTAHKITRKVVLEGIQPIMFDRYSGDNETQLEPWQKFYFAEDGQTLVIPSINIISFLSSQNTDSAPKKLLDPRKYKKFCAGCLSYITISPAKIPIIRNGEPIEFGTFKDDFDALSGAYVDRRTARLKDGIPNLKVRPVLDPPWSIEFTLTMYQNKVIQETQVHNVFAEGGLCTGLGTYRGQYGKFIIAEWEDAEE